MNGSNSPSDMDSKVSLDRLVWADLCRVVAICGVILIHSCGLKFYAYGKEPLSDFLSANVLDSLARVSVPLFVMLSGAMTLKPSEQISIQKVTQRVSRVLLPLITWSGFYLYWTGMPTAWLSILKQPAMYHLWFVYMIVGLYLISPFLQMIFDGIRRNRTLMYYFATLWIVVTIIPSYYALPVLTPMQFTSFLGYGGYFILGGLLAHAQQDRLPTIGWVVLYLAGSALTFALTWYWTELGGTPSEAGYLYFTPNVMIAAMAAFMAFVQSSPRAGLAKPLHWISDRSFIIFFVHVIVLEHVQYNKYIQATTQSLPGFMSILIIFAVTFIVSLLIAGIIRLIPGVRRVAG